MGANMFPVPETIAEVLPNKDEFGTSDKSADNAQGRSPPFPGQLPRR